MRNVRSQAAAGQGGTLLFGGAVMDLLIQSGQTGSAFSLLHLSTPPGWRTPPHLHRAEDQTIFVLSGFIRAETADGVIDLMPGQAVTLRRGRWHRIGNVGGETARLLMLCTPGGFERFISETDRPLAEAEGWNMSKPDLDRLMREALHYGIEVLAPEALALASPGTTTAQARPETLDVFGVSIQFLAELGPGDNDVSMMRGRLPPNGVVPLHSHADREVLYVLSGTLDISLGPVGEASWRKVTHGGFVDVAGGTPHALRNAGDVPVDILLVATRRIGELFREIGDPPAEVPPGPPSPAKLAAFAQASHARGYWLANPQENAAIGLNLS